jgi:hypothetical protein
MGMKPTASLMALVALALSAPLAAQAEGDGRHHGGGWQQGAGRYQGGPPYGGPQGPGGPGGQWRGREEQGRPSGPPPGAYEGPPQGGRWTGGRYGPPPGYEPPHGEPQQRYENPRAGGNSLGEGWSEQQNAARAGVRSGQLRPMGGVLSELRRRQPGRPLDAGIEQLADGREVYRVRWAAANGRRIDFIVDARTGAILAEEGR